MSLPTAGPETAVTTRVTRLVGVEDRVRFLIPSTVYPMSVLSTRVPKDDRGLGRSYRRVCEGREGGRETERALEGLTRECVRGGREEETERERESLS